MGYKSTRRHAFLSFNCALDEKPNALEQIAWISKNALVSSVEILCAFERNSPTAFAISQARLAAAIEIIDKFDLGKFAKHWPTNETRFGSYFRTTNSALDMAIYFSKGMYAASSVARLKAYPSINIDEWELDAFEDWQEQLKQHLKAERSDLNGWPTSSLWEDADALQSAIENELAASLKSSKDLFHNYFSKNRGNGKSFGDPNPKGDLIVEDPIGAFIEECDNFAWAKHHHERASERFDPPKKSDEIFLKKTDELLRLQRQQFRIRNSLQSLEDEVVDICLSFDLDPKPVHLVVQAVEHNVSTFNEHLPHAIALLKTAKGKMRLSKGALPAGKRTPSPKDLKKEGKTKIAKKAGRKVIDKIASTPEEKQVLNLHFKQDKSAAIIAQDAFGDIAMQDYVQKIINRLSARKKRKKDREISSNFTKS